MTWPPGSREEVEHERIEDALGHRGVPTLGERGHGPAAAVSTIRFCPWASSFHGSTAPRRSVAKNQSRSRQTEGRDVRPPMAPPWSCPARGSRSGAGSGRAARLHHRVRRPRPVRAGARPGPARAGSAQLAEAIPTTGRLSVPPMEPSKLASP